ncbi:MAG: hypothetical protein Q7J27_02560 [Syntrophales bacterium]|nr:hypothetical protein [Syntrophales bacterium]
MVGSRLEERLENFRNAHLTFFFEPYEWQERALKTIREKNMTAIIASNKIGKSCLAINMGN